MEERGHVSHSGSSCGMSKFTNTGGETARFLVHTNRPALESTGYIHTQQGEPADYDNR